MMEAQVIATNIVKKLAAAGFTAYFAGGWVRDYIMGHPSDDIDIATNAPPNVILDLFPRTILVGLAFGIVVVVVDGHQFEVATFRRDIGYEGGRRPTQIELATPEEDASRRDFTINGMFYDPIEGAFHDFVHGKEDITRRLIRAIGDPFERFVEDRLRMIRAVRFAARFDFIIDEDTQEAIRASADTLFPAVAMERVWQEFCKMANYPGLEKALIDMHRLGLLSIIFPALTGVHLNEIRKRVESFVHYPKNVPTIWYLLALFPEASRNEAVDLCRYLRTSVADTNLAEYLVQIRNAVRQDQINGSANLVAWTHLYAHPEARSGIEAIAAYLEDKQSFMAIHAGRMQKLEKHIMRVINKKPLVNAALLQQKGIVPGKLMGVLLKEAESIAILHDLNSAEDVLGKLNITHKFF